MESPANPSVLLVEDSLALAKLYAGYLQAAGLQVSSASTGRHALEQLNAPNPPLVLLLDLKLPDMDGLEILEQLHQRPSPPQTVIMTAHGSVETAVEAMRLGAFDFLEKPFDAERLITTVGNAARQAHLRSLLDGYRETYERDRFEGFLGASLAMQRIYRIIESAAPSKATVFITGESGTGKELCAEALHRLSPRADGPLVALNCAAIPGELMETEIFGHVRGAFTGATGDRTGAAARADGGTLFLDEVCELPLELQSKLLRFIQTGSFQAVGSGKMQTVDTRFVCATNRDPWREVQESRFREDLYYRLHVIPLQMPPLRDRGEDVLLIARSLLIDYAREEGKAFSRFSADAETRLRGYAWPGNVRELQNVVRNLVVLNDGEEVSVAMLPPQLLAAPRNQVESEAFRQQDSGPPPSERPAADREIKPLWLVEKQAIESAIERCDGNVPKAAALLEISPSTIYRKRQAWEAAPS